VPSFRLLVSVRSQLVRALVGAFARNGSAARTFVRSKNSFDSILPARLRTLAREAFQRFSGLTVRVRPASSIRGSRVPSRKDRCIRERDRERRYQSLARSLAPSRDRSTPITPITLSLSLSLSLSISLHGHGHTRGRSKYRHAAGRYRTIKARNYFHARGGNRFRTLLRASDFPLALSPAAPRVPRRLTEPRAPISPFHRS